MARLEAPEPIMLNRAIDRVAAEVAGLPEQPTPAEYLRCAYLCGRVALLCFDEDLPDEGAEVIAVGQSLARLGGAPV